jgi:hypothetical protein
MNWDAIGAIGELVGAITVLITLVYLAIQVKQNSVLAKVQINQSGQETFSRYRRLCIENSAVVAKTYSGAVLTDVERVVAQNIVSEALFAAATQYSTCKVIAPERSDSFIDLAAFFINRHNWQWDYTEQVLSNAGFSEFSELVTRKLNGEEGDTEAVMT